ncbi:MAG: glutamyl-tRNA reductase [Thermodesulfobacteriota bacterium]|nr:glutamyl-tRNA reductase [Thermodesulfobacteriota bacterium]
MEILILGLSHKTAPIEIREKLSFSSKELESSLGEITGLPDVREGLILSTCNRVEILAASDNPQRAILNLKKFLSESRDISIYDIEPHLYTYYSEKAIQHIFKVASSLDSMVVGEPQILGQLKEAYRYSTEYKASGSIIHRLLHKAFKVAKRVRSETLIASHAVSVGYAAVELAKKIFAELKDKRVMLIGSGEMAELAAKHLINAEINEMLITNRTFAKAREIAEEIGGTAVNFEVFPFELPGIDIIISSTSAEDYILKYDQVQKVMRLRKNKPMFFIDIAVPRDIDPEINRMANVYLYNIDDLTEVVETNLRGREKEALKAEKIIDREKERFYIWLKNQEIVPTIASLRNKFEAIRSRELEKALKYWPEPGEREKKILENLTDSIVNKIIHDPIQNLKQYGNSLDNSLFIETIRRLFNLDENRNEDK